jgi:hypothetical protein
MIRILLLCALLFQAAPQPTTKPVIDNERVTVWEVSDSAPAQPNDALVLSSAGKVAWVAKGQTPQISGKSIVIVLKDHSEPQLPNPTKYPLTFPRPGAKKLFENDKVDVWEQVWTPGVATPMHFHDKDVVVWFMQDGDLKSTTPDGKETVNKYTPDTVRFNARNRTHTETLVRGQQKALITELK